MVLICDAGTTGCDWLLLNQDGNKEINRFHNPGINPTYQSSSAIHSSLLSNEDLIKVSNEIQEIYFFGSGCGMPASQEKVHMVLKDIFANTMHINVKGDVEGAVYASVSGPGVVGILGTGSNICYYDGAQIHLKIPSLGFHIMDQGSGNAIGRRLLQAFYFNQMPEDIKTLFSSTYNLEIERVKKDLYSVENVSRYMAGYARFLFDNKDHDYLRSLLKECLEDYFNTSVNAYLNEAKKTSLNMVGSIAHLSKGIISELCNSHGIQVGNIVAHPIDRLAEQLSLYRIIS
ncbi:MAG: hypothetical protein HKN68_19280 [Saprospiraceae bacterium]|nr:hypothetical protein [Saprospiraceae bacterium]